MPRGLTPAQKKREALKEKYNAALPPAQRKPENTTIEEKYYIERKWEDGVWRRAEYSLSKYRADQIPKENLPAYFLSLRIIKVIETTTRQESIYYDSSDRS